MDKYLQTLLSMRTISQDKEANKAGIDFLASLFEQKGLHIARFTFNGYSALVATTKKDAKQPAVLLAAHLDVVPGPDHLFELRVENGNYLGRGVFDMQFAIASYLHLLDALAGKLEDYDFGIMITTDEELGGLNGVAKLVEHGYKPGVLFLPDGATDWQIETLAKGFVYGHIAIKGRAAHGSKPWDGDSATFKLMDLLQELRSFFADQSLNTNTLNVGMLEGGAAINQIPASATATLDIRFVSMAEKAKINELIDRLCQKYDAIYEEEPLDGFPCVNDLAHPLIQPFAQSIQSVVGVTSSGTVSTGASDARFFAGIGVPSIICRPAGGGQHADSEWIDKEGYEKYHLVLLDYLQKVAKI